jgi:hypothetical protein
MKKIIASFFFSFLVFSSFSFSVLALVPSSTPSIAVTQPTTQELESNDQPAQVEATKELRAEFKQYTQDPRSKKIRFEMILKPTITSERVEIQWAIRGVSTATKDAKLKGFLRVKAGETYRIPIEVVPTTNGATEIYGRAQVFEADSNIVATVRKNFASNIKGEVLPISSEYKNLKSRYQLMQYALYAVVLFAVIFGGFFGLRMFIHWLDKNDVK